MLIDNLRFTIDYALEHAEGISGEPTPRLFLMGHSAGASAIAAVASDYAEVEKILLLAPSLDAGKDAIRKGLEQYTGEMYIVVGMDDTIVRPTQSKYLYHVAQRAEPKRFVVLWNCDHDFSGARNYDLLRKAPRWAFFGDEDFPDDDAPVEPGECLYR